MKRCATVAIAIGMAVGCQSGGRAPERDDRCSHATNAKNEPFPYAYAYPVKEERPSDDLMRREKECIRPGASMYDRELFYCCQSSK